MFLSPLLIQNRKMCQKKKKWLYRMQQAILVKRGLSYTWVNFLLKSFSQLSQLFVVKLLKYRTKPIAIE